jgi:formate-dependent phosphoribosylglycinamide formyltransferase (GAR transformylase)
MKKALLVGSSFSAAPIYSSLKRRGLSVTVCGSRRQDPCHQYDGESEFIDYSDRRALLSVIERGSYDFIVPTCNDFSYLSACWVADKVGFCGFDSPQVADILHTKHRFRSFTNSHGIPSPKSFSDLTAIRPARESPILVKPVDSFSGRGVSLVDDERALPSAIRSAENESRTKEVVAEEYVAGSLHSHSAFIKNQKVVIDFFVDEFCTIYEYQVNCSNHPSRLGDVLRGSVRDTIEKMASLLGLVDGLLHTQFIVRDDAFWIIECMRRCPGDLYSALISRSTQIDYIDNFVCHFLGEDYSSTTGCLPERFFGRHTISFASPVVLSSFNCDFGVNRVEIFPLKNSADVVGVAPNDKAGIIFVEFDSREKMFDCVPNMQNRVFASDINWSSTVRG